MEAWTKKDYILDRTKYWMETSKGMTKKLAKDCAEEDWERYCEKYKTK